MKTTEFLSFPSAVRVVFLDMDHTLISTDCDVTWKEFLASKGMAGWTDGILKKWHYFQYRRNRLNISSFMKFQLKQFRGRTPHEMQPLLNEHFETVMKPAIYSGVKDWIQELHSMGLKTVLCTATNEAIARPLFEFLGLEDLIATRLLIQDGHYTGDFVPPYVWERDKLIPMKAWLQNKGLTLSECSYWGDSRSDIPVLEAVGFPVAANPQKILRETAQSKGWHVVDFNA